MAPVIRELRARAVVAGHAEEVLVCTAGEDPTGTREVLHRLDVPADEHADISARTRHAHTRGPNSLEALFAETKPEWLIVQGDSPLINMASLAAFFAGARIANLDSGLRPWQEEGLLAPEEWNSRLVAAYASMHLVTSERAKEALLRVGVPEEHVLVTGNTEIDELYRDCARLGLRLGPSSSRSAGVVRILIATERQEDLEQGVGQICRAVRTLSLSVPGLYEFLWPLQSHAKSTGSVRHLLAGLPNVVLPGPDTADRTLRHLSQCDLVITDSDRIEAEAPSFGKPVLVLRETTERPEGVRDGTAMLVGLESARIQAGVRTMARKLSSRHRQITSPYGDGKASGRIADFFEDREVLEFGRMFPVHKTLRSFGAMYADRLAELVRTRERALMGKDAGPLLMPQHELPAPSPELPDAELTWPSLMHENGASS